ncbi:MAG: ferredoxin family protein [Ignavibacteriaceae bacterium]
MIKGTVIIDQKICKGCELCIVSCPQDGLALSQSFNEKGYRFVELINDVCTGCVNCALVCPEAAITVYRQAKPTKKTQVNQSKGE